MQPNEIQSGHVTTSLKVVLLIFAVVLVGALAYLVWTQNKTADNTDYSAPSVGKQTSTQGAQESVPLVLKATKDGWTTYEDSQSKISFSVPSSWTDGQSQIGSSDYPSYSSYQVNFKIGASKLNPDNMAITVLSVSTFDQIKTQDGGKDYVDTQLAALEKLKTVFRAKNSNSLRSFSSPSESDLIQIPYTNAATIAISKPEYISSSNDSFRGIAYFGVLTQDSCATDLTNVVAVTDNSSKVVQVLTWPMASNLWKGSYEKLVKTGVLCEDDHEPYRSYYKAVEKLTSATSDEAIIDEYNQIHKKVVVSLKNI